MQNSAGIVDFPPSHACIVEVSQIHSSPTPTHHPTNPVNSKNPKYPTREKMRNPASAALDSGSFRRGGSQKYLHCTKLAYCPQTACKNCILVGCPHCAVIWTPTCASERQEKTSPSDSCSVGVARAPLIFGALDRTQADGWWRQHICSERPDPGCTLGSYVITSTSVCAWDALGAPLVDQRTPAPRS